MSARDLPARPSLAQYRKQAKELVKGFASGDRLAIERVREHHPRFARPRLALADAQLVIAREHGFTSWPKFTQHLEALASNGASYRVWKAAEQAILAGDAETLEGLFRRHPRLFREHRPPAYTSDPTSHSPDYPSLDARAVILGNHEFADWDAFSQYMAALKRTDSPVARFEAAVDAIVHGEVPALERLLGSDRDLVRARSPRTHRAMLLHYVGANGVEGFRQRTPANAVAVLNTLLDAGADVNARADMYGGGSTTLGLVATSIHPAVAGVQ